MTNQEIFDKVAKHLLTQNAKSMALSTYAPLCSYRGENGMSCAIGCLIPDELYSPSMEGRTVFDPKVFEAVAEALDFDRPCVYPDNMEFSEFLLYLQRIHDTNEPDYWPEKLSEFAITNGLDCAVVTNYTKAPND